MARLRGRRQARPGDEVGDGGGIGAVSDRHHHRHGERADRRGDLAGVERPGRAAAAAHEQHQAAVFPAPVQGGSLVQALHQLPDRSGAVEPTFQVVDPHDAGGLQRLQRFGDVSPALARRVQDADPLEVDRAR